MENICKKGVRILQLILSISIAQCVGIVGSFFVSSSVLTWYPGIVKSSLTPASWIFSFVWITLYMLMGFAFYLVWQKRDALGAKKAIVVYGVQLVFNVLWPILFFGLQNPSLAFLDIIALTILVTLTMILFWEINRWAGMLFIPYVVWVCFAVYLNFVIWHLN